MGFGMRKEDYTRTPRKSFKRLKKIYGEELSLPKSEGKPDEDVQIVIQRKRFKHIHQTLGFKIVLLAIFTYVVGYLMWNHWLIDVWSEMQIREFETTGIVEYYNENKSEFLIVKEFVSARSDRLSGIRYDEYSNASFTITFWDSKLTDSTRDIKYHHTFGSDGSRTLNERIENGNLVLNDSSIGNWVYTLRNVKPDEVDKSFIDYANSSPNEFYAILALLAKHRVGVENTKIGTSLSFHQPPVERYSFMFSNRDIADVKRELSLARPKIRIGNVDDGVYWIKYQWD